MRNFPSSPLFYSPCLALRAGVRSALLFATILLVAISSQAQSTYGTILGTVRDASGAVIPGATVTAINKGTSTQRTVTSDGSGEFTLSNVDIGLYSLTVTATGFEKYSLPELAITAREMRHIDAALKLGSESQTVEVQETAQNVITTEVSNLSETKLGTELVSLPVAIFSRSTGSTSPIDTLTTEAGVQTDDGGNLVIAGATPALLSVTVDGISSVGVEYSGPINEMFPSFNSIEEIHVSESNNNAEFSGVADITTVSKPGTGSYHGGVFENLENTALNAGDPFQTTKTKIVMNDFGGTLGGPLSIPHLYNGKNKTFFFASFEALRLPRQTPIVASVPTLAMRGANGTADLTSYLTQQCANDSLCPTNGLNSVNVNSLTPSNPVPCPSTTAGVLPICQTDGVTPINYTQVPVSAIAANALQYLFPLPNYGPADSFSNNYRVNFPSPISTNQGDIRLDQTISARQSAFARFSYKNRQVTAAPDTSCTTIASFCQSGGSPLQGGYNIPEIDEGLTFAYNYIITPKLLNEFRGGYNAQHTSTNANYSTSQLLQQTGLSVLQVNNQWAEAPDVLINGFIPTGGGNPTRQRSETIELLDNVTWNKGHHNYKFGFDVKRLTDHDDNVFGNDTSGYYVFNGSSPVGTAIGDSYTSFLAGFPDNTQAATINKQTMDGIGYSYAFYGQDDWKITPRLTLNLGLRYELHPPLKEQNYNTAFFLPDYNGPGTDGSTVHGAVVVPNQQALSFESQDFINSISPTPTLTAQQAGLPETLRYTDKNDYGPRIGFAWRPFGDDKTVLRGGWGRFIESPLGFSLVSGWAVDASYVGNYAQGYQADGVTPVLSLSNAFPSSASGGAGTAGFYYAFPIHYKDPSVQQWNLTVEQDLGKGIGMRFSYIGSHGTNLESFVDLNQVPASTTPYANQTLSYPDWSVIQSVENLAESNYNSATVEVSRHSGKNLTFDASYTFTRDLSDAAGATPSAFAGAGGNFVTDRFHPGLDYGNVSYDRKNRFLVTYLYDLPFGKGQRFLPGGGAVNAIVGDWHLGGVTVLQSGPFLTPYQESVDPANTNILNTVGQTHSDIVPGQTFYATKRTVNQWLNVNAFALPPVNAGRFGNATVGDVVGPGSAIFSMSLRKEIALYEHAKFEFSLEAANAFNRRNYEPPNMQIDSPSFGQIPELQTAEGAGPRSLEVAGRINF